MDVNEKKRIRIDSEKLKEQRKQRRIEQGLPEWGSITKEYDKKAARNWYARNKQKVLEAKRAKYKKQTEAEKQEKALLSKEKRRLDQLKRNEQQKEKRRLARIEKSKVLKQPKIKPLQPLKKKKVDKPIKEEKVLQIRDIDLSELIPVIINSKTKVYVKPGTDIEEVKRKFESRRI